MEKPIFYHLIPYIQTYAWGNRSKQSFLKTFIRKKQSIPDNDSTPFAELWKGTHKKGPAKIKAPMLKQYPFPEEEIRLDLEIQKDPQHFLGNHLYKKQIQTLPFLFKILDAEYPLSIQAHPDKTLAQHLHQKDPKNYPDPNHKPELAISLGNFEAIVGFRPEEEIIDIVRHSPFRDWLISKNPNIFSQNPVPVIYKIIMTASQEELQQLSLQFLEFLNHHHLDSVRDPWFYRLIQLYGKEDPGIFCIYLFNYYRLRKGEGIFLEPNVAHAYLKGEILECMADSDNVVRGGLTQKYKDIETLLSMLNYKTEYIPPILPQQTPNGFHIYPIPVKDFIVKLISQPEFLQESHPKWYILTDFPSIMVILEGKMKLIISSPHQSQEEVILEAGEIIFFPGDVKERKYQIQIQPSLDCWSYLASTLL